MEKIKNFFIMVIAIIAVAILSILMDEIRKYLIPIGTVIMVIALMLALILPKKE